jgi:glycosyltransferase involved in cell wall biosynthesis
VCPASCLYIKQHNTICERCLGGNYLHCVRHRCLKASLAASTLACIAQYLHRATAIFEKHVDVFICPSTFLAEKMAQGGIPEKKLRVLQNFLDLRGYQPKFDVGDYFVFMGRLAEEKGITTLLDACARVPEIPVQIVGEGEHEEALKALAKEKGLTNLRFVGYQGGETLKEIVQNAAGVLIPSEWYENCPMVTYEAYALGKPVVASRIGGIPESIEDGVTGYLTEPGDAAGLAECMKRLATDPAACQAMGRAGRKRVEHICEGHYEGLMAIYEEARGAIIS